MKQIESELGIKVQLGKMPYMHNQASAKLSFGIDRKLDLYKLSYDDWKGLRFKQGIQEFSIIEKISMILL